MSPRANKICGHEICSRIVPPGVRYCDQHRTEKQWRGVDSKRSGATGHQARRQRVLRRDNYLCQLRYEACVQLASHVDHVVPLAEGGADDDRNCAAACSVCHAKKSSMEAHKARGHQVTEPKQAATQSDPPMRVDPMQVDPEMPSHANQSTHKPGIPRRINIW